MKLSRGCLSRRMQECVFGSHHYFSNNLCNHFWKTIFTIVLAPVLLPINWVDEWIGRRMQRREFQRRQWRLEGRTMTTEQIYKIWERSSRGKNFYLAMGYQDMNPNWPKLIDDHWYKLREQEKKSLKTKLRMSATTALAYLDIPIFVFICSVWVPIMAFFMSIFAGKPSFTGTFLDCSMVTIVSFAMGVSVSFTLLIFVAKPISEMIYSGNTRLKDDVFVSYLKSVKKRMCPLIEWVD